MIKDAEAFRLQESEAFRLKAEGCQEGGNHTDKIRNEFHAKDATSAKGSCSTLGFHCLIGF